MSKKPKKNTRTPKAEPNQEWGRLRDATMPRQAWFDSRHEPGSIASNLDGPRLRAIIQQAEGGNPRDLFLLYRDILHGDTHLLSEFSKRKMAVLRLPVRFEPADPKSKDDATAAKLLTKAWAKLPNKISAMVHLLNGSLYPVAILEKAYAPSTIPGLRWQWGKLSPVPYHLLSYASGELGIEVLENGQPTGRHEAPSGHIIHRGHMLTGVPDNFGGPMRAGLFWWLFKTMDRTWWIRFLERHGAPFTVVKYDDGRPDSRSELQRALSDATRLFGLVVTSGTEVELMQANTSQAGDAFEKFKDVADRELSKLIVGQTSSSEARSGGLNSGQADLHAEVKSHYELFDSICLAQTLSDQMATPLLQLNGLPGQVQVQVGESNLSLEQILKILETLPKSGLEVGDDALGALTDRFGLPVQRKAEATPATPPAQFSGDGPEPPRDTLATLLAADLAPILGGELADVLPLAAKSPAEFLAALKTRLKEASLVQSQASLARALAAYASA